MRTAVAPVGPPCVMAPLQAFLREGGLVVNAATVIKQAQVTALADSNSAHLPGRVVGAGEGAAVAWTACCAHQLGSPTSEGPGISSGVGACLLIGCWRGRRRVIQQQTPAPVTAHPQPQAPSQT